jgi:two-component system, OmpR family, phosphate regulon sensor histidine kinase PhoR
MAEAVVALVLGLGIALAVAVAFALRRERQLGALRALLGIGPGVDLDVALRSQLESRAAAEQVARLRLDDLAYLTGILGVGVLRFDDQLRVTLANQATHAFLRRPLGSLMGRSAMETFADHTVEVLLQATLERGAASGEFGGPATEDPALLLRARRAPGGGLWVVLEDVTELRRLQRIRTEFVDNLSHELRTPLTNVRLLTEMLARDLETGVTAERARERVATIEVETEHLVQMLSEMLELSRIEGGAAELLLDVVDLRDVVNTVTERLRLFAERQDVHLETELAPELPLVNGDAERLGQVLANLLHNAIKFSPEGGLVIVTTTADATEVSISVRDQGPGIPKVEQARIFERFYKADRARVRGKGGTGLGLAIARHIVEAHGGRIWVESEEGQGATFRFSLPVAPGAPRPEGQAAAVAQVPG